MLSAAVCACFTLHIVHNGNVERVPACVRTTDALAALSGVESAARDIDVIIASERLLVVYCTDNADELRRSRAGLCVVALCVCRRECNNPEIKIVSAMYRNY